MKTKILAAILVSVSALTVLASCGPLKECDFCGKTKICKTEKILGQEIAICGDCEKELNNFTSGFSDYLS